MVMKRKGEKKKNINDRDLLPIVRRLELAPSHPFFFSRRLPEVLR